MVRSTDAPPADPIDPLATLSEPTRAWFRETFLAPSPPQALGWPAIARGEHTLLLAPTGSGKTLAAFLFCLDRIARELSAGEAPSGIQVLYVSPLKALSNDLHRNLELPLSGMRRAAERLGLPAPEIRVGLRTGDTPAAERARLAKRPPHVLCTTPESLYLLLTSRARATLAQVRYLIVDEIHALAGEKRGVHLALTLERLEALIAQAGQPPPVRIGLSATQRPLETIAHYLGGGRPVTILDSGTRKALEVSVDCPVEDLKKLPESSIWPALAPYLAPLIAERRTALLFVNDRRSAERLCTSINEVMGRPAARAHHGALSRQSREEVEGQLKAGALSALVCTSSLELGIDIGTIDLVVQLGSPGGVSRALQRIGRAGHQLEGQAIGRMIAKARGDLLECAAVSRAATSGEVELTRVPEKCLDVLAQQVVAMAAVEEWPVDDLWRVVRRAWPYRDLRREELLAVLEMLGGRYPAEEMAELRPRIVWDRVAGRLRGRPGSLALAVTSGGTIPDKGLYAVELGEGGPRLGELDEEFVFESRVGDVFQLGSGTWRIERIGLGRVTVTPAPGEPPRLPFWHGEGPGRSAELGEQVGALCRRFEESEERAFDWLTREHHLSVRAAHNLITFLAEQRAATSGLPTDRRVVVEHFADELGDRRVAIHLPLGKRVTTPLGLLVARRLAEVTGVEPSWVASDDGLLFRLPAAEVSPPPDPLALIRGVELEPALVSAVSQSSLFGARFRENAARALILPRRGFGRRTPLYLQRIRAQDLLEVAGRHPDFPILVETYRECLRDAWELDRLRRLCADLESGRVEVAVRETGAPSPFAAHLLYGFLSSFLYNDDLPRAEKRLQLLPAGRGLLAGLLKPGELSALLDPAVMVDEEARATRTDPRLKARDPDELHDLLRRLGPLREPEIAERIAPGQDPLAALATLAQAGRALKDGDRWLAVEDRERHLAAQAGAPEAVDAITRRALRAGGPAPLATIADRAALPSELVQGALARLTARGEAVADRFHPGATEDEFADAGMVERLHRRSLAAARRAVRPVEPERYAAFLLAWQHLTPSTRLEGPGGLERVLEGLAGYPLPGELAEREVIARRLRAYDPAWLDRRISDGEWTFRGAAIGNARLPRVSLWPRADLGSPAPLAIPPDSAEGRVLAHLSTRGASFFTDLWSATELDAGALGDALWELLLAGAATNDRFEAIRRGRPGVGPERIAAARAARPSRITPRFQSGRWSLAGAPPTDVEWWALRLLDRYGIVAREQVAAERGPSFGELLPVWKRMELRGEVRRGYFVEGLSGLQLAWPRAVELLRKEGAPETVLLSSCDPACAYGPLLPSPLAEPAARLPSNFLVLEGGRPALSFEAAARRIRLGLHDPDALARAALALATTSGTLEVEEVDGVQVRESILSAPLLAAGFEPDGARLRRGPLKIRPLG